MLQIVASNGSPVHGLALACRHVETAIAHINNVAQSRVPHTSPGNYTGVDELRLIVRALADIREALRTSERPGPAFEHEPAANHADRTG